MISNLIPVIGVLFLGWSVYFIMILFWLENVIIGSFNVLKMLTARGGILPGGLGVSDAVVAIASHARWLLIPFFIIHYGGFALVHGFFVWMLFRPGGFFGGSTGG